MQRCPCSDGTLCRQRSSVAMTAAALGLGETLVRQGVRIPDDLSVVGYDDSSIASLPVLNLTTVRHNPTRLAAIASDVLVRYLDDDGDFLPLASLWTPTSWCDRPLDLHDLRRACQQSDRSSLRTHRRGAGDLRGANWAPSISSPHRAVRRHGAKPKFSILAQSNPARRAWVRKSLGPVRRSAPGTQGDLHRAPADQGCVYVDCGEVYARRSARGSVVVANDGEVVGRPESSRAQGVKNPER